MTDEFEGMGGSYVMDKKTGKRKLIERTDAAIDHPTDETQPSPEPAAVQQKDELK